MALLALIVAFSHGGSPSPAARGIAFGRIGGNIIPFTVIIEQNGTVSAFGAAPRHQKMVSQARLAQIRQVAEQIGFTHMPQKVVLCPKTLPDVASQFVRIAKHTIRVHGTCVKRFNTLWAAVQRAVGASGH
jgi:hypothetical protein